MGQAPSRETDGLPPFVGKCGEFLSKLMGSTHEQMLLDHEFYNVFDRWPGKGLGGDLFPIPEARRAAKKLVEKLRGRTVVLLGANVARAFNCKKFEYFCWYSYRDPANVAKVVIPHLTVVPHPSQRNRIWNSVEARSAASRFLVELVEKEDPQTYAQP